jgi:dTDP-4-dehydrorhamnose reductase
MSLPAPPTAIVTGASGQIGRALRDSAPAEWRFAGYDRATLDVTRPRWVAEVLGRERPALVINAAAYTAVDDAEREVERTEAVNCTGAAHLAEECHRIGARLIHLSTDFVFDGGQGHPYQPGDRPNPLGVYGRTKLAGEREVTRISGGAALVVRTAWIYASRGRNFVLTMLRHLRDRPSLGVVADQIGSPTWARSVAEALWAAAARPALRGVLHWTDAGVASWYDFAVAIQEEALAAGLLERSVPIRPLTTGEYPTAARRPAFSVLDTSASCALLGLPPRHWRENLRAMLREVAAA